MSEEEERSERIGLETAPSLRRCHFVDMLTAVRITHCCTKIQLGLN